MNKSPLFRQAALDSRRVKWLGNVVLARPLAFTFMAAVAAGSGILIIAFLVFGSYTKRTTVLGQLAPDMGVLKIFTSQPGTVSAKYIREGQIVNQGDVLYVVSSERRSGLDGRVQETISRQVRLRQQSLREELMHTRNLQQSELSALQRKIDGLETEGKNIVHQLTGQLARIDLAEKNVERAAQLFTQGYYSSEMSQQKEADLIDQRNRLAALEREQIGIAREIHNQRAELINLPFRQRNQLAQIQRGLMASDQELSESEAKRRVSIPAPESGIATAVLAEVGQGVDGSRAMVSIIPNGAMLQAHLFAPSRSIGFVRPGDKVLLRFQAYPYQKFGHTKGTVVSVSRTVLSSSEIASTSTLTSGNLEALYRVTVALERQSIVAYGKVQPLQSGMLVDADILQEKRRPSPY